MPKRGSKANLLVDRGFRTHEASVMLLRAQLAEAPRSWGGTRTADAATGGEAACAAARSGIVRNKTKLMSFDYLAVLCAKTKVAVGLRLEA